MEFLDINLTNDSSLLLNAKENHTLLWFKNPYKKIFETRKLEFIHE
jgi:hypothetical protein